VTDTNIRNYPTSKYSIVGQQNFYALPQPQPIYLMRKSFKISFPINHITIHVYIYLLTLPNPTGNVPLLFSPRCPPFSKNNPIYLCLRFTRPSYITAIYLALKYTITLSLRNSDKSNHICFSNSNSEHYQPLFKRQVTSLIHSIRNLLQYLLHLHNCKTSFIWVPRCTGIPGNESPMN